MTADRDPQVRTIQRRLRESGLLGYLAASLTVESIARASRVMSRALEDGRKLVIFGNGGSAAEAQHFAAEFVGRFLADRRPLPALALTTDTSVLTAVGNDYSYEDVFARQVQALGQAGDVAVGLTTSGRSANVIAALEAARASGMHTIAFCGADGVTADVDEAISVPSRVTARVQEAHLAVLHILCELVEDDLGLASRAPERNADLPAAGKIIELDVLLQLRERWRDQRRRLVWTNGCFDLLHVGHVRTIQASASLGDVLVVGVNDDTGVRALKGPGRPVQPAQERAEIVAALEPVDHVVVFQGTSVVELLDQIQPDVHTKGGDYSDRDLPERSVVERHGGVVRILHAWDDRSTSRIVRRIAEDAR